MCSEGSFACCLSEFVLDGASWRLKEENFLKDVEWLDNLKFKVSYGSQGNDYLLLNGVRNRYAYMDQFSVSNNNGQPAITQTYKGNDKLKWETNYNFNTGIEFSVLNGRLSGGFEFFSRYAKDLLFNRPLAASTGSNSKGFTCTALAILADEGKLNWDDKVTKFLPDFKMYDDYVTQELTIKDLVTHRAGLGLGQGDLMFFPEGGTMTTEQLLHNVRYLKPAHSFRNTMDYNNVMFIVAGEVIHKISGKTWAEFIEERIMKPVGMTASFGSYNRAKSVENKIDAHAPVNGKAVAVPHDWNETANAAGGILSNITDMTTWANFLMGR